MPGPVEGLISRPGRDPGEGPAIAGVAQWCRLAQSDPVRWRSVVTATGWVPSSGRVFQSMTEQRIPVAVVSSVSCSSGIGLLTSDPTDSTGAPLGSAKSTDTPLVSARTRTRTTVAPLAWSTTRFHTNGTTTPPPACRRGGVEGEQCGVQGGVEQGGVDREPVWDRPARAARPQRIIPARGPSPAVRP